MINKHDLPTGVIFSEELKAKNRKVLNDYYFKFVRFCFKSGTLSKTDVLKTIYVSEHIYNEYFKARQGYSEYILYPLGAHIKPLARLRDADFRLLVGRQ